VADVEEDKPEPDLDELLELFREPEEEPRRKKATSGSVWLMLAFVLSLAGVWMAARTTTGPRTAKTLGPPVLPTKVSNRKPQEAQAGPVDVVENYIARCKKGMTEQEVRWIIEDFQKAGLAQGVRSAAAEEFIHQRKAQHAWYLDLLADGLRLDPEQRRTASGKLAGLLEEAVADFQKSLSEQASEPIEQDDQQLQLLGGEEIRKFIDAGQWLTDERYAPWELCDLTEAQLQVTWHPILADVDRSTNGKPPNWLDAPSSELVAFEDGKDPAISDDQAMVLVRQSVLAEADHLETAGLVFPIPAIPLSSGPAHKSPLVRELCSYHSSQLKTLLLLRPKLAEEAMIELDQSGK
jgi:hypothetical protein